MNILKTMKVAREALQTSRQRIQYMINNGEWYPPEQAVDKADEAITALSQAIAEMEQVELVAWIPSAEWTPCVKLPVTVHVRKQRDGETHVSTREGITPVKPDDLIMRGVSGEEYPIGRAIYEQTYRICDTHPAPAVEKVEPVLDVIRQAIEERDAAIADCDLLATERHDIRNEKWRITGDSRYRPPNSSVSTDAGRATAMQAHEEMKG